MELAGIEKFGPKWEDKRSWQKPKRDADGIDRGEYEHIEGQKAPEIPGEIAATLEALGAGSLRTGLRFLGEHPRFWNDVADSSRVRLTLEIEAAWKKAWMRRNV